MKKKYTTYLNADQAIEDMDYIRLFGYDSTKTNPFKVDLSQKTIKEVDPDAVKAELWTLRNLATCETLQEKFERLGKKNWKKFILKEAHGDIFAIVHFMRQDAQIELARKVLKNLNISISFY